MELKQLSKEDSVLSPSKDALNEDSKKVLTRGEFDEIDREYGVCQQFWIHFGATILKRFRVIKRDLKSFLFELVLPIVIIIFALLLMQISFITEFSAQTINVNTYLSEQNPVLVPVASTDATFAFANTMKTTMETKYGTKLSAL